MFGNVLNFNNQNNSNSPTGIGTYTAEQVGMGHPDKFCDKVSDSLLTSILAQDSHAHCAIETLAKGNTVVVAGEVTTEAPETISNKAIEEVVCSNWDFLYGSRVEPLNVVNLLESQSPEIFDKVQDGGAGDQGIMVGYATWNEDWNYHNPEYYLATSLLRKASVEGIGYVGLDAKSQVTLVNGEIGHLVFSAQQIGGTEEEFREVMMDIVFKWAEEEGIPRQYLDDKVSINPGGLWTIGGPTADSGLTGRKIIADTYGPSIGHGGGAFSGKDYTKVDRSGAYLARCIAKSIVRQTDFDQVNVELAYQIGYPDPVGFSVRTDGVENEKLTQHLRGKVDFSPIGIAELLSLRKVNYGLFCTLGHFMHKDAPWETVNIEL